MIKKIVFLLFSFLQTSNLSAAFTVEGKAIHPGCVYELTTQTNGDNIVSSVNLTRTRSRGCLSSNRYFQNISKEGNEITFEDKDLLGDGTFSYKIWAEKDNSFLIRTKETTSGTFSGRQTLIIKITTVDLKYFSKDGMTDLKTVQNLKLIGEIAHNLKKAQAVKIFLDNY